jgi:hypothetical protein
VSWWSKFLKREERPRIRYFVPRITGKLRYGRAAIFERIYDVNRFPPGAEVTRSGTILWIAKNKNGIPLRHYPDSYGGQPIIVFFVRWDDGFETWVPADAYQRWSAEPLAGQIVGVW